VARVACSGQDFTEAVERFCLTRSVTQFAEQGQGLPVMGAGLLMIALPQVNIAETAERIGLACSVAGLAEQGECLLKVADGLLVIASFHVEAAEVAQGVGLPSWVAGLAAEGEGLLEVLHPGGDGGLVGRIGIELGEEFIPGGRLE
jgi:hypothetical protein